MRVRNKELTLRKAAEIYKIPRSTISDRVTGKVRFDAARTPKLRRKGRLFGRTPSFAEDDALDRGESEIGGPSLEGK